MSSFEQVTGGYRPKTKETRVAFEELLSFVSESLGDQPRDVIKSAADEVLAIMKNDATRGPEKKKLVERVLIAMSEPKFSDLSETVRKISDYSAEELEGETLDDELGVAVVFDEDEEDDTYEVKGKTLFLTLILFSF